MVKNIPTLELKVSEGFISEDADASRAFGYCVEGVRGPILEPTFVSSNNEALKIFGCNFEPHFKQNPTGLIITRISYPNMKKESLTYSTNVTGSDLEVLKFESISYGSRPNPMAIKIVESMLTENAYDLTISIPEAGIVRTYRGVKDIFTIVKRVSNNYSEFVKAEIKNVVEAYKVGDSIYKDIQKTQEIQLSNGTYLIYDKSALTFWKCVVNSSSKTFSEISFVSLSSQTEGSYVLTGGSNGVLAIADTNTGATYASSDVIKGYYDSTAGKFYSDSAKTKEIVGVEGKLYLDLLENKYYTVTINEDTSGENPVEVISFVVNSNIKEFDIDEGKVTEVSALNDSDIVIDGSYDTFNPDLSSYTEEVQQAIKAQIDSVNKDAYEAAFAQLEAVDLVGCSVLTKSKFAHMELLKHVEIMNDSEINKVRFAVTAFLDFDEENLNYDMDAMMSEALECNNEYVIYIGGAVKYFSERTNDIVVLPPYKAVQLFTGIRSKLAYYEAIFGGEPKKVLKNVKDIIPLRAGSIVDLRESLIELNEAGVCFFKKEYGDVTFIEGVTTSESDLLSHEDIMSVVAYVSKALIQVCKPYQGQKLTEDLKTTLSVALSDRLKTIQETDKSLISIDEYNIPPYDVEVSSAALVKMNENNQLVRESKIIVKCKIVPIGALRDIDLGIIVI